MSILNEFQDVFLEDLQGIPPESKIDCVVDLDPTSKQINIYPYRMDPTELKKLKLRVYLIWASSSRAYPYRVLHYYSLRKMMEPLECVLIFGYSTNSL